MRLTPQSCQKLKWVQSVLIRTYLKSSGLNSANPLGAISSIALMLESLGFEQEARWVNQAVKYALETNNTTKDLGGRLGLGQVGDFIANQIRKGTW